MKNCSVIQLNSCIGALVFIELIQRAVPHHLAYGKGLLRERAEA